MSTIILKNSSVAAKVPLPGDLSAGELAINTADVKLYMKNSVGTVINVVEDVKMAALIALLVTKVTISQGEADAL